ncbi:iron ABC transporter permease [Cognatiyoonia sp. IB215182]|uniref:FecCD family ABC transporter permease n=1 Tax=Cognatiyoonia sp. IB215182 TaxID=3097353 RepID=UPI002A0EFD5B|nr:iron ABC transporter permease [Cognatiyoonia sp. IB215182]MDX8354762.1 iron ABC transporter permease [Cognatiyoonia sp. IB215182]
MAISERISSPVTPKDRRVVARQAHIWLALALILVSVFSLATGPTGTSLWGALGKMFNAEPLTAMERVVLWDIRMPRLIIGILVGAGLAVSGALMQGLFRNPLADPGLVGVGAGGTLGAILAIVLGSALPIWLSDIVGNMLIPVSAFFGSWLVIVVLYRVSTRHGRTSVATMLLAGIALAALAAALSGIMIFMADDQQLRDLTFWSLGSLAGATWTKVVITAPLILIAIGGSLFLGRGLNALALGEATASHLGIAVQRLKLVTILIVAMATGAAVAVSGGIGFIGIIVPHLLRLATGPDHQTLLLNVALLGATILLAADIISRLIIAPAELPIGIVTAVLGSPVFLWILLRRRGLVDM